MSKNNKPRRQAKLIPARDVHAEWRKDPAYREAYDAIEDEFSLLEAIIKARVEAGLTQGEIAQRMKTTQSAVARLESQAHRASLPTLRTYAAALGRRVRISFEPLTPKS